MICIGILKFFLFILYLSCLVFSEFLRSVVWCLPLILESSQPLLFHIFSVLFSLFFSFWYSIMCMLHLLKLSTVLRCPLLFVFILFPIAFQFLYFSVLKFPFDSFLYISISLLRLFFSPFVSSMFVIVCWSILMMAALKSLSGNTNTCVICVLVSVDCPFLVLWLFWRLFVCAHWC